MKKQRIEYKHGSNTFYGELFWDESRTGRRPGIVVYPEGFGLNDHARQRGERLAQLGYVALVADPHGKGTVIADMAGLMPALQAMFADRAEWRGRARAAYDALLAQPQVDPAKTAAIGFCFGGSTCVELVRTGAPLAAIATFHAGLLPELPGDAGRIRSKVLICHGAEDPLVPKEVIDTVMAEFRRDKVDWQFIHYGNAAHSFSDPEADQRNVPGLHYNVRAEARSWAVMRSLFEEALG